MGAIEELMGRPALFLDRDGTINIDRVYINDPRLIALLPGAAGAIRRAQDAGFAIVVVTNQSGVGRGIIHKDILPKINARVDELLRIEANATIDLYQQCLHAPAENCDCRKPSPKLVFEAAQSMGIDLKKSAFIGDKLSDIAAGKNAGCKASILLRTGKGEEEARLAHYSTLAIDKPEYIADDLAEAVDWFLKL